MSELDEIRRKYDEGTQYVERITAAIAPGDLDRHAPGEWSARQTIHHLADSETMAYTRLRRLLAEPEPVIQGYDEAAWASAPVLGYADLPVDASVALYRGVRAASAMVLRRLSDDDLERAGMHTEGGRYTVRRWLENYTEHPFDHGAQIERALRGEP